MADTLICPSCGKNVAKTDRYCPTCEALLRRSGRLRYRWGLIGVGLLVVIVLVRILRQI
jgi:predicted nucleic acid-binding Zn ribbon protein